MKTTDLALAFYFLSIKFLETLKAGRCLELTVQLHSCSKEQLEAKSLLLDLQGPWLGGDTIVTIVPSVVMPTPS